MNRKKKKTDAVIPVCVCVKNQKVVKTKIYTFRLLNIGGVVGDPNPHFHYTDSTYISDQA